MTETWWLTNDASEYRGGGCVWCSRGSVWTTHSGSPVYNIKVNEVCCKGHISWVIMSDIQKEVNNKSHSAKGICPGAVE